MVSGAGAEEALLEFKGTIVFVSHDRYFIDAIATRLWSVEDGIVTTHLGNYTDHERRRQRAAIRPAVAEPAVPRIGRPGKASTKPAVADNVEEKIEELETELRRVEARLADGATYDDPALVAELSRAHQEASARLRTLFEEWEHTAEEPAGA